MPGRRRPQVEVERQGEALDPPGRHPEDERVVCPHLVTAEAQPVGDRGLSRARDAAQADHVTAGEYCAGMKDLPPAVLQDEREDPAAIDVANLAPRRARVSCDYHISLPPEPEDGNAGDINRPGFALPVPVDRWAAFRIPPDPRGRAGDLVRDGGTPMLREENQTHSLRQKVSDPVPWASEAARRGREKVWRVSHLPAERPRPPAPGRSPSASPTVSCWSSVACSPSP